MGVVICLVLPRAREEAIRRTALERDIPCLTTLSAAAAALEAIRARGGGEPTVTPLQEPVR